MYKHPSFDTYLAGAPSPSGPGLRLTVEDIVCEGETVAARVAFHGIPPSGKEVAFSSMEFNRVVGGKVEEHWVEPRL